MIQVKDIVKSFEGNVVLDHVSADFEDGKVNMIIGQSGSGKTVLMKSMIGLHQIDAGQIIFDTRNGQENLAEMKEKEVRILHREVGMLFQGSALFDSMTVQENVMYPLEMFSQMSREEMVERALLPTACEHARASFLADAQRDKWRYAKACGDCPSHCTQPSLPILRRAKLGS